MEDRIDAILSFWFGRLDALGRADPERRKRWWTKSDELDQTIKSAFLADYDAIVMGQREMWRTSARGALAYIIVLDQFSRNMFRGAPRMFAADVLAREACQQGLLEREDAELAFDEKVFFYLPLMHSEDISDQHQSVGLFQAMVERAPEALKGDAEYYLDFAERHRTIVERFGRFPHRNETLGRASTADEAAFLKEPGSSF